MLPSIDLYPKEQIKKLFICNSTLQIIAPLKEAEGISYNINDGTLNEISFRVPLYADNLNQGETENKHVSLLQDRTIILYKYNSDKEYFIVSNVEDSDDEYRNIHCYSLGYQLNDKRIRYYKSMDYVTYTDPNTNESKTEYMESAISIRTALTDALQRQKGWTIGYIDPAFDSLKRYFEFDDKTQLEYVYEIAEKFNAVIHWDSINKEISAYHPDNYGNDKGLKITNENYISSIMKKSNQDEFCTRLFLYGKDGITVNSISPSGQSYIEDYSFFYNVMSTELYNNLISYQSYVESRKDELPVLLTQLNGYQTELNTLQIDLSTLENNRRMAKDRIDLRQVNDEYIVYTDTISGSTLVATGIDSLPTNDYGIFYRITSLVGTANVSHSNGVEITEPYIWAATKCGADPKLTVEVPNVGDQVQITILYVRLESDDLTSATNEQLNEKYNFHYLDDLISAKKIEINNKQSQYDNVDNQIKTLQNDLSMESHFTTEQLKEFEQFVLEKDYSDENLVTAEELLEEGKKQLEEKCAPKISFDVSLINFFELLEEKRNWNRLSIHDLVRIKSERLKIDIKARIINISISDDTISLTIANTKNIKSEKDKTIQLLYSSVNTTKTLEKSKSTWNQIGVVKTDFDEYSSSPINAYEQGIEVGERITIDENGLISPYPNQPKKQIIISNGVIAGVLDGENWTVFANPNGVIADALFGNIDSKKVKIINDNYTNAYLYSGWVAYGTGSGTEEYHSPSYRIDASKMVDVRGSMRNGTNGLVFILPTTCRPKKNLVFPVYCGETNVSVGKVTVKSNGEVHVNVTDNTLVSFDNIPPFSTE